MGFDYTLVNQTPSTVIFGLWNAPDSHEEVHEVKANDEGKHSAKYGDARIVGVWLDTGNLYQSNTAPFVTGHYFMDGGNYTITLTTSGLTIAQSQG